MWSKSCEYFNPYLELRKAEFIRESKGKRLSLSKTMMVQKLIGFALLLISVVAAIMVSNGRTVEDRDATGAVFVALIGLYLLFTKEHCIDI